MSEDIEDQVGADLGEGEAGIPSYEEMLRPCLAASADGQPHTIDDLEARVAEHFGIGDELRRKRTASGRPVLENRAWWTRTLLFKAGLVDVPEERTVVITDAGRDFLARHPEPFTRELLLEECPSYAAWQSDMGSVPARPDETASVWMVRAGEAGVFAPIFIQESAVLVGWGDAGDVGGLDLTAITERVVKAWPDYNRRQRGQAANTLYKFANTLREGDVVVTPEPATRTLILGVVSGRYQYNDQPAVSDEAHRRPVRWRTRVSRDQLSYGARSGLYTQITLSRPTHATEYLRIIESADEGEIVAPLTQRARRQPAPAVVERVVIPASASAPTRTATGEFHTLPRPLLPLLSELHTGQLALPDFQRSFVWEPEATRELVVSMIRSFPAGALLFLQGGAATFKARAVEGAPALATQPSHLVLDGQQRLTSLYQVVYGVGDSRFFLDMAALLTGAEIDAAVRVFTAERAQPWQALEVQARSLMMPLAAIRHFGAARWRDQIVPLREEGERERLRELLLEVEYACIDPLVQYVFPVTLLPETTALEAVTTIFETLNRTGKPLTPFELISARAFAGGHSLYDFWNSARERYPILADFELEPYYLLQAIALRLGSSAKRAAVLGLKADDIAKEWPSAVDGMASVLTMLRDECGVLTRQWLPYRPMLIPLATVWRDVEASGGPARGGMREKLKRWFWCESFTGEYESASATLAERDAAVLHDWLIGGEEPPAVRSFNWDSDRWLSVTPRQQGLYRATMALMLVGHPRDFHTGAPLTPELIDAGHIDDHHIFPRAYLRDTTGLELADVVLNRCLIDRTTNNQIRAQAPSQYLAQIREQLGEVLDAVLSSHQLPAGPVSPLERDDYQSFLSWRADRLARALEIATGHRSSVSPAAERSDLDLEVESMELAVRRLIGDVLDGDLGLLPQHVQQKVSQRLSDARRRDPSRFDAHSETLAGQLGYCDLRDLQDVLTAKPVWPRFEEHFGSKDILLRRFDQLAELRNCLAHNRPLDNVTRKEGEAAIAWFRQVLSRATAR